MNQKTISIGRADIEKSYLSLVERSKLDISFIVLTLGAAAICAFGFKMNSPAIIVGAMVVSPLLYPVVGIGAATWRRDGYALLCALVTVAIGIVAAISMSAFFHLFFITSTQTEITSRLSASIADYFFVALFSGLAGTFAFFWPSIIEAIAGIAISVALLPPVIMIGIGLGDANFSLTLQSASIVLANIAGIWIGSLLMYGFLHYLSRNH